MKIARLDKGNRIVRFALDPYQFSEEHNKQSHQIFADRTISDGRTNSNADSANLYGSYKKSAPKWDMRFWVATQFLDISLLVQPNTIHAAIIRKNMEGCGACPPENLSCGLRKHSPGRAQSGRKDPVPRMPNRPRCGSPVTTLNEKLYISVFRLSRVTSAVSSISVWPREETAAGVQDHRHINTFADHLKFAVRQLHRTAQKICGILRLISGIGSVSVTLPVTTGEGDLACRIRRTLRELD